MKGIFQYCLLLVLFNVIACVHLCAQTTEYITGAVIDKIEKTPMAGVTIYFEGETYGVSTDAQGKYKILKSSKPKPILVFSILGYEVKKVEILKQTEVNVAMVVSSESLDDVIVTGFAPIRKEGFSGNSTRVTKDDILKANPSSVLSSLQSFDPSFRLVENLSAGSNPNAMPEFAIRGQSGIGTTELDASAVSRQSLSTNPNLPIFILDGFEVDVEKIYDLDPTRIHSVNILKDAAATAFYGSRAANGVIVIELRSPQAGKLRLQYNNNISIDFPDLSSYNLMNASEKLEAERLAGLYDSRYPEIAPYTDAYYARRNNILRGVDTYWLSQGLRTGVNHRHSIYVDGGENDVRWGLELNYSGVYGVMKHSSRSVVGVGFYVDYRLGRFQIKNKVSYTNESSTNVPFNSFSDYSHLQPYMKVYDEDGYYLRRLESLPQYTGTLVNPLYEINNYSSYDKSGYMEVTDNLLVNWDIMKGLKLRLQASAIFKKSNSSDYLDPSSAKFGMGSPELNGEKSVYTVDHTVIDGTLQLLYNASIKGHNINVNLSSNLRQSHSESNSSMYRGFPGGSLTSSNYAAQIIDKPSVADNKTRLIGFLLTGNYTWNDIYFGDLTGRADGSSEFGADKRWSLFWATGAGINIHNYNFLKGNKVLSTLKLRVSYGLTGKTNIEQHAARDLYDLQGERWFPTGYGVYLSHMGNPNLKWERTYKLDYGGEVGFLHDRIHMKISSYNERTIDLITDMSLPSSTGFTSHKENMGVVKNVGIEATLRVMAYTSRNFTLSFFGNFACNRNTIVKISEAMQAYNKRVEEMFKDYDPNSSTASKYSQTYLKYYEGASMTAICGMRSLGISPTNGKEIFLKANGDVTDQWSVSDWTVIGDTAPKGQGSFGVTATYRNWTLYTSFLYRFGGDAYNYTLVNYVENVDLAKNNADRRVLFDRWQKPGDVVTMKNIADRNVTTGASSRFVQKDNMLQFSSVTLSYDFNQNLLRKAHIGMCRLSLSAGDLFYLSTIRRERGLSYPYTRSCSFSMMISF